MKRSLLIVAIAILVVAATAGLALAGNSEGTFDQSTYPGTDASVHSGYATSTNACKFCHDVHENTNYKLFISATVSDGCAYCHETGVSGPQVYQSTPATGTHRIETSTFIPDASGDGPLATSGQADELDCLDCHAAAPHGAGGGAYGYLTTAANQTTFCVGCHDSNDGRVSAGSRVSSSTHVMVAEGGAYTENGHTVANHVDAGDTSATCVDCHTNAGDTLSDFPHESDNFKFLKAAADTSALDTVCMDCHGAGVGITY